MKKLLLIFSLLLSTTLVMAQQTWKSDPMHSKLGFGITHLGISTVEGYFDKFSATVSTNKTDFSDAVFNLTVQAESINTGVKMRDDHLRNPDFFEVSKFPTITFTSSSIKMVAKDKYELSGDLTMHGVTKPVVMQLWYRGTVSNPQSKASTAGFQLTGTLKRADFNIGPTFPSSMLSEEVHIKADGEFVMQK